MGMYDYMMPYGYNKPAAPYQPIPQPQPSNSGILWVQGEAGAKSWMMQPSSTVILMDSENPVMYIKSTDAAGMPTMRIYDYKERSQSAPVQEAKPVGEYCTKTEFDELVKKYTALEALVTDMNKPKKVPIKKEANDE